MERGAWQATVHGVTKSRTRLSDFTHSHMYVINTYTYAHTQPHRELINSIRYVKSEVVQMKPLAGDSSAIRSKGPQELVQFQATSGFVPKALEETVMSMLFLNGSLKIESGSLRLESRIRTSETSQFGPIILNLNLIGSYQQKARQNTAHPPFAGEDGSLSRLQSLTALLLTSVGFRNTSL